MNAELVSAIVTTRNSGRTLKSCLGSIRSQVYRPIELIVVDNGSTDETLAIAHSLADRVESAGPERSAQRNYGARIATGPYLVFIDSDMVLTPQVVSDCVAIARNTDAPAVVIPEVSIGEGFLAKCRAFERSFYVGDDSIEAARFFRRETFERLGGFDEQLTGPEDWDLSMRAAAGRRLSRTSSHIVHDEGRLRLGPALAKKRYYAAASLAYMRKHRGAAVAQANLVFRPAFIRGWKRFLRHPALMLGVLSLKSLESGAVAVGILDSWARGQPTARRSS